MELVPWAELSQAVQIGLAGLVLMFAAIPVAWAAMLFLDYDYFKDSEPARIVGKVLLWMSFWTGMSGGIFVVLAFIIERVSS